MTLSVFDAAREAPLEIALIADDRPILYAELAERVAARRVELLREGHCETAQPYPLLATPDVASVTTLFALLACGIPALLMHARSTAAEREDLLRRVCLAQPAPLPPDRAASVDPESCAVMLATSGSSGRPKIAKLSHRALLAAARASAAHLGVDPAERWLACLPLAHVGGLSILTRMLFARRASVLFDARGSVLAALAELAAAVEQHGVTLVSLVPTLLERLLDTPGFQAKAPLRAILLGGAAAGTGLLQRAAERGVPVLTTYGLTETAAQVCTRAYARRGLPAISDFPVAPSGMPVEGAQIRIADGQIEVRGPMLFSGYVEDSTQIAPGSWFRTHDRGFIDANGELVVTGRASDCIVTGGENVDPAEVESALSALPGVRGACVFGMPDGTFGEVVAAVIAGETRQPAHVLAQALRGRISGYKLPRRVAWVEALPLLASGKIDRAAARRLLPLPHA